jgi:hypothetical protein
MAEIENKMVVSSAGITRERYGAAFRLQEEIARRFLWFLSFG